MRRFGVIKSLIFLVGLWIGLGYGIYRCAENLAVALREPAPTHLRVERVDEEYRGQSWLKLEGQVLVPECRTDPGAQPNSFHVLIPMVPVGWRPGDPVHFVVSFSNVPADQLRTWQVQHVPGRAHTVTGERSPVHGITYAQQQLPRLHFQEPVVVLYANQRPTSLDTSGALLYLFGILFLIVTVMLYYLVRGPRPARTAARPAVQDARLAPVPVGRRFAYWKLYVPLGLVAFGLTALSQGDWLLAAAFGGLAAALGLLGLTLWFLHQRRRLQVLDLGNGFCIIDRLGFREYRDDEVLGLALVDQTNYLDGLPVGRTRQLMVWVLEGATEEQLDLTTTHKLGETGPLDGLIQRLCDRLFEQARQDRAEGQPIFGQAWSLQGNQLTLRPGGLAAITCRFDKVVTTRVAGTYLDIWEYGIDEAVRIPLDRANTFVLARLLAEELANQATAIEPMHENDMGRIVFEVCGKKSARKLLVLALGLALVCGLSWIFAGADVRLRNAAWIFGLAAAVAGGVAGALSRSVFRCRAFGLHKCGLGGQQSIWFDEVRRMTYSNTRVLYHGAYVGTSIVLRLLPFEGKAFQFQVAWKWNGHEDLDFVRDYVAEMISRRWLKRFREGRPVTWTKNLRFLPGEGLEYYPKGRVGREEVDVVPFADIHSYSIENGVFYLWAHNQRKSLFEEPVSRPNFFPGYFLLIRILAQR